MAGAFWFRPSDSTNKNVTAVATHNLSESNLMVYQKNVESDGATAKLVYINDSSQNSGVIKVADLPSVNGKMTVGDDKKSENVLSLPQKPSGSVLAYDDIKDKSILYTNGVKRYSKENIKSPTDTNRSSLLVYGTSLAKIINGYPFYEDKSPTEITFDAYNNKSVSDDDLAKLETIKLAYELRSKNLSELLVPSELTKIHINLTNSFDRTSQLIKNMEQVGTDNLLALNSARQYVEETKLVLNIFAELNTYFKDKGINIGENNKVSLAVDVIN